MTRFQQRNARIAGFNQNPTVVMLRKTNLDRLLIITNPNLIQRRKTVANLANLEDLNDVSNNTVQNSNQSNQQMVPLRSILKQPNTAPFNMRRRKSMPALKVTFNLENDSPHSMDTNEAPSPNRSTSMSNVSTIGTTSSMGNTSTPMRLQIPVVPSLMGNISPIASVSTTPSQRARSSAVQIILNRVTGMSQEGRTPYVSK